MSAGAAATATSVAVVGEALIDVIHRAGGVEKHTGGGPLNIAVGLARLGVLSALVSAVGDDEHGDRIRGYLAENGVTLHNADVQGAATSTAIAQISATGDASYQFAVNWAVQPGGVALDAPVQHVHVGSLGAVLAPGADAVFAWARGLRASASVSFDPNCRPLLGIAPAAARVAAERFVRSSDIVKASEEDLGWLYPGQSPVEAARRWAEMGPELVVVTRGGDGSVALTPGGAEAIVVDAVRSLGLVDTVGAGDSYMAALVAAIDDAAAIGPERRGRLDEQTLRSVLRYASAAAAITCSRAGANPPTRAEVARLL
ncbi:PfkB family carbohydrate kinase [Microterricola pindariensis]|uniref:Carbohydrate kinase PfkB domain-containing protein n=1 Tax=Microterricola pindariensis TaxID=478010 RepID=A0ABX5B127_9MICO|nr:PfkB family carbohydrate kinase [Microterricola pindariensis]PPL20444.1 hypothetical protein GY24_01355 [Microterricola pindariensis]